MTHLLKNQYAGFRLDETLASRIRFDAVIRVAEKTPVVKNVGTPQEFCYWSIKDDFGARFTVYAETLAEKIVVGETYELRGEIKIGKGGMYLNIKSAEVFCGSKYKEVSPGETPGEEENGFKDETINK